MSRVRVPLPFKDQLDVWGDYTRRQMHEAVLGAKVKSVPVAALLSTQETVGSEMLARYMRGKGKSKNDPIAVPSAEGLAIYDGHHRVTKAIKSGATRVRVRVASPAPRPPRAFREKSSGELLMMRPEATTALYQEHDVEDVAEVIDGIAIVCIDTPLESKPSASCWGYFDDYESILCRFENAIRSDEVKAVLLKIDSPGGAAQGLNACVDAMRKCKKKAGKPVIAFADEGAYSAAYALACVADAIYLPKAGGLGSIGVIARIVDWTEANKNEGIRVETITTGKRKADGDPNVPVSKEAIAHLQRRVDQLGDLYFKLVEKARGIDARGLQADTFYGKDAVKKGLADKVMSLDHLVKRMTTDLDNLPGMRLASPTETSRTSEVRKTPEARMDLKALAAALEAAVADGDKKKIAKASAALEAGIAASKKVVTTETKSTESSSSSSGSEEEEEEEESGKVPPASASGGSSMASSKSSSSSSEEEEEEEEEKKEAEEEKAAAKSAAKALAHATSGHARRDIVAAAIAEVTAPLRAVAKAAARATGRKSLSSIAGALAAMPKQREATAALRKEVDALKSDKLRAKVDGKLAKAERQGKITAAQRDSLRAQGMKDPKWLKGHLATLPKQAAVRTEGFVPLEKAGKGAPQDADQQKIRAAMTANMSPEERGEFDKTRSELEAKLNGTIPRI